MTATLTTITLPAGVIHHTTTAHAETWAVYDGLVLADGWDERSWSYDADRKPCEASAPGAQIHIQKEATIDGCRVVVFRPYDGRPEVES